MRWGRQTLLSFRASMLALPLALPLRSAIVMIVTRCAVVEALLLWLMRVGGRDLCGRVVVVCTAVMTKWRGRIAWFRIGRRCCS
ncbi:hypothetical protein B0H67DRAFT_579331 [Lasiosphaeris hirsuta]|uniref:Uncharacterized protein n=1 Tax=Lasiosphaeris hirsuta TaxID=260670 RepID=A0AA40AFH2_9PEZI|nr:hypothetical protein B0H67DRAFT_579331 [Lasiosphaeris hirsuta]